MPKFLRRFGRVESTFSLPKPALKLSCPFVPKREKDEQKKGRGGARGHADTHAYQ